MMNENEITARALLSLMSFDDLMTLENILIEQKTHIDDVILPEKRMSLMMAIHRMQSMGEIIEGAKQRNNDLFLDFQKKSIVDLQTYANKANHSLYRMLSDLANKVNVDFTGNIFSIPPELRSAIETSKSNNIESSIILQSEGVVLKLVRILKEHITYIEKINEKIIIEDNIINKNNKIISQMAQEVLDIINLRNSIDDIIQAINSCKTYVS